MGILEEYGQRPILDHYQGMTLEKKKEFLDGLEGLDLKLAFRLYQTFLKGKKAELPPGSLCPAPILPVPGTPEEKARWEDAFSLGESLLRRNEVAVLIVAGGQGTRLGFPGPKGKFPVSPLKNKSLFQLFAESLRALSTRYKANIPLLIMTSRENRDETREFFSANGHFGLDAENVYFFNQGMLPTLSPEGKLLLKGPGEILANPDGHGGSLKALYESGLLRSLREKGFTELFYCQVDNPLVKIADPAFLGYHRQEGSEISTKVVRRNLEEKVGIYGLLDGKPAVIEYSDCRPEDYGKIDEQGNVCYWAGNIAVHVISLEFVERLNSRGFALPFHRAVKEVECLGPEGKMIRMAAWKFETFVFDSIPLAKKACCLEVTREEEFSPVKNSTGIDSPETARAAMVRQFKLWLREAGVEMTADARVEISPLFALHKEELLNKLRGTRMFINEDKYFG